jgi:hypothetical protein
MNDEKAVVRRLDREIKKRVEAGDHAIATMLREIRLGSTYGPMPKQKTNVERVLDMVEKQDQKITLRR